MSYIQLIEKAVLPTSLWLTFWDIEDKSQLSLEIAAAAETYEVGRVYRLDRDARFERLALEPLTDLSHLASLDLLIPIPIASPPRGRAVDQGSVSIREVSIREASGGTTREHGGLLSLLR